MGSKKLANKISSSKKSKLHKTSGSKKYKLDDKKTIKPAKQSRAPERTTKLIDPITQNIIQTVVPEPLVKKQPKTFNDIKKHCPNKKSRVKKTPIDTCISDEKTKPWIKNFYGTLIQLGPDQPESKLFTDVLVKNESTEYPGWWIPSDNYYSIICKANEHFLPIQKGPIVTIKTLDSLPSDTQLSQSNQSSIVVKVANIVDEPYLLNFPNGVKGKNNKWLLPENNDYIGARKNYLSTKLNSDDTAIDDMLSSSYSKLFQEKSMNEAIQFKIHQYLDNFSNKLSSQLVTDFSKLLNQEGRMRNLSLEDVLTMMIKTTLFLRNEFNIINKNLIVKINNGVLKPKQLIDMNLHEILPELYYNPELDIQIKRDELTKKINNLIEITRRNIVSNILIYKMIIDRSKFWTQNKNLKQLKEDIDPIDINSENYDILGINDVIPLYNICAIRSIQENGKQISLDDIDDLGGVVFYKDPEGHLYCFTLQDIKKILASGSNINPLSGKEFHNDFLKTIQKLNLVDVSSDPMVWHPANPMEAALFGDDDDDSEWDPDDQTAQDPDDQTAQDPDDQTAQDPDDQTA